MFGNYIENPYKGLFLSVNFIPRKKLIRVSVSRSYIKELRMVLGSVNQQKRERCIHLYLFITYCNGEDIFRILRNDLQQSFVGGKAPTEKMISECTGILQDHKLIDISFSVNDKGNRINSYVSTVFKVEDDSKSETFELGVSDNLNKLLHGSSKDNIKELIIPPSFDHLEPLKVDMGSLSASGNKEDYAASFMRNYTQLRYRNGIMVGADLPIRQKDGRIHHKFHELSKEIRENEVMMDGEHITEVWDLHNAFFVLLYSKLLSMQKIDVEDDVEAFGELVMSGKLYDDIQSMFARMGYNVNRDKVKEILNRYKNTTRSKLLYPNGNRRGSASLDWFIKRYNYGDLNVAFYCFNNGYIPSWQAELVIRHLIGCVDGYFEYRFPTARNYLIDYPTRTETEEYVTPKTKQKKTKEKVISNLQRDITPLEFRLISCGVCRTLLQEYGIKCLTVHDAIYVKVSDAIRIGNEEINIDRLLLGELEVFRPKTLFDREDVR